MNRYSVVFFSDTVDKPLEVGNANSPGEAVKIARKASSDGFRRVRILDLNAKQAHEIDAFASMHRV